MWHNGAILTLYESPLKEHKKAFRTRAFLVVAMVGCCRTERSECQRPPYSRVRAWAESGIQVAYIVPGIRHWYQHL